MFKTIIFAVATSAAMPPAIRQFWEQRAAETITINDVAWSIRVKHMLPKQPESLKRAGCS